MKRRTAVALTGALLVAVVIVIARFTVAHLERAFFEASASDVAILRRTCEAYKPGRRWEPSILERDGYRIDARTPNREYVVERGAAFNRCVVKVDADGKVTSTQYFPD